MEQKIRIFVNAKDTVFYEAVTWFKNYGLTVEIVKFSETQQPKHSDIIHMLCLTENGFPDIVKRSQLYKIEELAFNQAVNYIVKHPKIIKNLFFVTHNKFMAGFDAKEIRRFLPRARKRLTLEILTAY
ncbi:hypothetical protein [Listeria innocua]|uniref:hypothetical protein n=1 Tax=Listeria innocua TaxID=1642 RepID=UPI001623ECAC|nr:hypothetical protein [Listeria innocua]MBC1925533.1 hypothetical protein [Listeria innocua]